MGAAEPTWRVDAGRRGETISASERRSKLTEVVERDDGLLEMHENAVRCRTAQRKLRVPNVLVTDIDRVHKRHDCPLVERPLDHAGRGTHVSGVGRERVGTGSIARVVVGVGRPRMAWSWHRDPYRSRQVFRWRCGGVAPVRKVTVVARPSTGAGMVRAPVSLSPARLLAFSCWAWKARR